MRTEGASVELPCGCRTWVEATRGDRMVECQHQRWVVSLKVRTVIEPTVRPAPPKPDD